MEGRFQEVRVLRESLAGEDNGAAGDSRQPITEVEGVRRGERARFAEDEDACEAGKRVRWWSAEGSGWESM